MSIQCLGNRSSFCESVELSEVVCWLEILLEWVLQYCAKVSVGTPLSLNKAVHNSVLLIYSFIVLM